MCSIMHVEKYTQAINTRRGRLGAEMGDLEIPDVYEVDGGGSPVLLANSQ